MGMMENHPGQSNDLLKEWSAALFEEAERIGAASLSLDLWFVVFLRKMSRFGYFSFGPINIDVRLIEDIVESTTPRAADFKRGYVPMDDDVFRLSGLVMQEVRRSGRSRIDELHFLRAFMRCDEGLPGRVFGELGVTPEQVEDYARSGGRGPQPLETLYSPEEAAAYLNVHVQTVRAWIRSGRLRARRLAGQRALRITAADLQSVLEPLEGEEVE
jgi:excisionase family DNA binding protein